MISVRISSTIEQEKEKNAHSGSQAALGYGVLYKEVENECKPARGAGLREGRLKHDEALLHYNWRGGRNRLSSKACPGSLVPLRSEERKLPSLKQLYERVISCLRQSLPWLH